MTPGRINGSVTLERLDGVRAEVLGRLLDGAVHPRQRARTTIVTNEMVNATCAMMMVVIPSANWMATKKTRRLTPTTISGITVAA